MMSLSLLSRTWRRPFMMGMRPFWSLPVGVSKKIFFLDHYSAHISSMPISASSSISKIEFRPRNDERCRRERIHATSLGVDMELIWSVPLLYRCRWCAQHHSCSSSNMLLICFMTLNFQACQNCCMFISITMHIWGLF